MRFFIKDAGNWFCGLVSDCTGTREIYVATASSLKNNPRTTNGDPQLLTSSFEMINQLQGNPILYQLALLEQAVPCEDWFSVLV